MDGGPGRPVAHVSGLPRLQATDVLPLRVAQAQPTTIQPSAPEVPEAPFLIQYVKRPGTDAADLAPVPKVLPSSAAAVKLHSGRRS